MRLSLVIPVFNGGPVFARCLEALGYLRATAAECIVVDDGSSDDSAEIARGFGATVLSTGGPYGPSRARNTGARFATGDVVVFIDADVVVHPDTLERFSQRFSTDPNLSAVSGSYDDEPAHPGLVSQYKNLQHAFVHQQANPQASTFWAGCGAVRRDVFLEMGGFDESYAKPAIEDIELGYRMVRAGKNLAFDRDIRCKHLKAWTLVSLARTDVFQRGIPWTRLILSSALFPEDLNLRFDQRLSVALTGPLIFLLGASIWSTTALPVALAAFLGVILLNRPFYKYLISRRGWFFCLRAIPLHLLYYLYSGAAFLAGAAQFWLGRPAKGTASIVGLANKEDRIG